VINTIYSNDLPLTCGGFARKNEDDTYKFNVPKKIHELFED